MYRGTINGKEVIIHLGKKVKAQYADDHKLYHAVLSYGETAFKKGQRTFGIYHDHIGLIVAEVESHDIPVIRVDYVIENENVYE